jgi:hypothetical protein
MKHIAIALALAFAVPLAGCQTLLAGQSAQVQQTGTQALIVSEVAYTQAVKTITALVESGTLKGGALTKVLQIRDKARKALDVGDGTAAMAATAQLTLAVGAI